MTKAWSPANLPEVNIVLYYVTLGLAWSWIQFFDVAAVVAMCGVVRLFLKNDVPDNWLHFPFDHTVLIGLGLYLLGEIVWTTFDTPLMGLIVGSSWSTVGTGSFYAAVGIVSAKLLSLGIVIGIFGLPFAALVSSSITSLGESFGHSLRHGWKLSVAYLIVTAAAATMLFMMWSLIEPKAIDQPNYPLSRTAYEFQFFNMVSTISVFLILSLGAAFSASAYKILVECGQNSKSEQSQHP